MLSFLSGLLAWVAILGYAFLFNRKATWSLSHSIFASVPFVAVLEWLSAVLGYIQSGSALILSLGCCVFALFMVNKPMRLRIEWNTLIGYCIGVTIIFLFAWGLRFRSIDDYSFWGVMSKHLFLMNQLPVDDSIITANFLTYIPGMAAFHYVFYFAAGKYSQWIGYAAQGTVLLAALMVLFQADFLRNSLIKIALAYILLSVGFGTVLARMEVDAYVGAYVFAIAWLIISRVKQPERLLWFPILFLSLMKEIGLFFALLMLVLLWFSDKKINKFEWLVVLISLLALKGLWIIHCHTYHFKSFSAAIDLTMALNALNPYNTYFQPAQLLFIKGVLGGRFGHILAWPNLISYLILAFIWFKLLPKARLLSSMNLVVVNCVFMMGLFLYLIMLYLLQAIVFQVGHNTDHLLDFQRYFNMLLIPFTMISVLLWYQTLLPISPRHTVVILGVAIVFIISGKVERSLRYFMPETIYPMIASLDKQLPKTTHWSLCLNNPPQPDYLVTLPLRYFYLPNLINLIPQFLNLHGSVRAEEGREPCLEAFAHGLRDSVNASRARTDRRWVLKTAQSSIKINAHDKDCDYVMSWSDADHYLILKP